MPYLTPKQKRRARIIILVPFAASVALYLFLQVMAAPFGLLALAACLTFILLVYRTEAQELPSSGSMVGFSLLSIFTALVALPLYIFYLLWGTYSKELGGASNILGQTFWEFTVDTLSVPSVQQQYFGELVAALIAAVVGIAIAWGLYIIEKRTERRIK